MINLGNIWEMLLSIWEFIFDLFEAVQQLWTTRITVSAALGQYYFYEIAGAGLVVLIVALLIKKLVPLF